MARPIVLSNGNLHVGLNHFGEVHDFYYPYVGLENHAAAKNLRHKIGVWVDGSFSWIDDGSWNFNFDYHKHSLIGRTVAHNDRLQIQLEFDDAVDTSQDVFLRNIHVINTNSEEREIRLFMQQVFDIGDKAGNGDTVQYLPNSEAILHYRGNRKFVVSGCHSSSRKTFDQYSMGLFGLEGHAGTYVDAEDGQLSSNNVEHGRVDSVIGFTLRLGGHDSSRIDYWIACGTSHRQAIDRHDHLLQKSTVIDRLKESESWWQKWSKPAVDASSHLDPEFREGFIKSVLLVKSHIDNRGAIIASTDTTRLNYSRDAYAYCWPRDGAYAIWPLIRLGYKDEPLAFFHFCKTALHKNGYLMHKFQADGSLGSSWHPYLQANGGVFAPIQEDETALVLFTFAQFHQAHKDASILSTFYGSLVVPMANFLANYIDDTTGLPKQSYDLWERISHTTTYTVSTVYGALMAAASLADAANDSESAVKWRTSAEDIRRQAHKYLYNEQTQCFNRAISTRDKEVTADPTIDISSAFGVFMFELFPIGSNEVRNSIDKIKQALSIPMSGVDRFARFTDDEYFRGSTEITGNPWCITSLWIAQYYLETNQEEEALKLIRWCKDLMLDTGVLPEQVNPYTDEFMSVAPLTWSQAEYASTLLDLINGE